MDRNEFMEKLRQGLLKMPYQKAEKVLQEYTNIFDQRGSEKEEETVKQLGNPEEIAKDIMNQYYKRYPEEEKLTEVETKLPRSRQTYKGIGKLQIIALIILGLTALICLSGNQIRDRLGPINENNTGSVLSSFDEIELIGGATNITICKGEQFEIRDITRGKNNINYKIKDKKLILTGYKALNFFEGDDEDESIYLTIPKDIKLDKVTLHSGLGNIKVENITSDSLIIYGGMGDVTVDDIKLNNLHAKVGMGNINIFGELNGKIKVVGGMGDVCIKTALSETDYNVYIKQWLGDVKINGSKYKTSEMIHEGAMNEITLELGLGDIEVVTD